VSSGVNDPLFAPHTTADISFFVARIPGANVLRD
jgi:hypothetical protein